MTRAERVLLVLLCAMVAFSPLFLGGVGRFEREGTATPTGLDLFLWAHGPYAILTFLAVAVAAAAAVVASERMDAGEKAVWRRHPWILLPIAGIAVFACLQLVPLPRVVLALLSPQEARQLAFLLPGNSSWRPLTVSPEGTRNFLGGLAIGGAVLLGTLLASRRRVAAAVLLGTLVATYTGVALYGLWEVYAGGNTVLGYARVEGAGVSGTFVNRSHMAAAAGLCLPVALAMGLWGTRTAVRGRWIAGLGSLLALGAAGVLAVAIPLTHSRMGLAAAAFGLIAFGLLASRAVPWPIWARVLVIVASVGAVAAGLKVAWDRVPDLRERFKMGRTEKGFFDLRFPAWQSTVELAARYPVMGTGLGSYEVAIHETQTPRSPDEIVHAHCEPLEMLADGGVLGLAMGAVLLFAAARGCIRLASFGDAGLRAAGCACGGALAAVLAGCVSEFHLHVPALGIAAAVLAAIPAALGSGDPASVELVPEGRRRTLLAWGAVLLGAVLALMQVRAAAAEGAAVRAEKAGERGTWLDAARTAVDRSGTSYAQRSLSGALLAGDWGGPGFGERALKSLGHADRAVDLEPFNAYSHWSRVRALLALGRNTEVVEAVSQAQSRAGGIGHLLSACGTVLLDLSAGELDLLDRALLTLREAGDCDPHFYATARQRIGEMGLSPDLVVEVVPESWVSLESLLEQARAQKDEASARRLIRRLSERR